MNPARSLGVAWFAGTPALAQVWLFIIAPLVGAVIAGVTYASLTGARNEVVVDVGIANNPTSKVVERLLPHHKNADDHRASD